MESDRLDSNAGIGLVESVGNWLRGIGIRAGFVPVAWDHGLRPGLIWRMPDRSIPAASVFANIQGIMVREFENAIVLQNGTFLTALGAGIYDVSKMPLKDYVEVVWVSNQLTQQKWGVGRVINPENITLGAHGYVFLQISDAKKFAMGVIAGQQKYTTKDLEDWVFSIIASVMRTQIAATTIRELMQGQEEFARACSQRLATVFDEWGITFKNLVVNQFDVPEEYRQTIAQVTMARYQRDQTVIEAEAKAQALLIESRAQAEARLTTGAADVELMARMQRLGLDPIRMKAIEALNEYAQLAAKTGGAQDSGSDMVHMMLFMQMSKLLTDPGMPVEAKDLLRNQFPNEAARVGQLPAQVTPASSAPVENVTVQPAAPADTPAPAGGAEAGPPDAARIQRTLDNLDERLASGEISEATYDRLRAKWEKRLAELESHDDGQVAASK